MHMTRLLVVVPAWNEQETVAAVVSEIRATVPDAEVVVVDDGSTDSTSDVVRALGVELVQLPLNLGVGGAMRAGFKYALRRGFTHVVQVDADGQHDPRGITTLLETMELEDADIVIGARFAGVGTYEVRGPRRWAMRVLSVVLSRVARTRLSDTTSGFKCCGPRAIDLFARDYPAEYLGDTIEALVVASRAGLRVREVPVTMRERAGGRPSHSPTRAAVFLVRAALALVVALSRPRTKITEIVA